MMPQSVPAHFLSAWTRQRVRAGEYIYQPADADAHIYLIEQGLVKLGSLGPLGERVLYDLLQPGETFGDLDMLDETEFFEFAQAATNLTLLVIDRPVFREAIVYDPLVAGWFHETIVRRWHKAESRLLQRSSEPVDRRIQRLRDQFRKLPADGPAPDPFALLSHQEIGDLVGATRQTVAKKLKQLPGTDADTRITDV